MICLYFSLYSALVVLDVLVLDWFLKSSTSKFERSFFGAGIFSIFVFVIWFNIYKVGKLR